MAKTAFRFFLNQHPPTANDQSSRLPINCLQSKYQGLGKPVTTALGRNYIQNPEKCTYPKTNGFLDAEYKSARETELALPHLRSTGSNQNHGNHVPDTKA